MSIEHDELTRRALAWADDDPDVKTAGALRALVEQRDFSALRDCFSGPIEFGTAGLRGVLGPGPSKMNEATVCRAAAGLARQIIAEVVNARERGVVVGRDARRGSAEMATAVAEVLSGHGVTVHWIPDAAPTPLSAFAGRHLNAAAIAIVTASHNPPEYNGLKVYSERWCQIISPQDRTIRELGDASGPIKALPRLAFDEALASGQIMPLSPDVVVSYFEALDQQCQGTVPPPSNPRIVTTALHGVGHPWIEKALRRRGFDDIHPVWEQAEPDGRFPTVTFPNPEEPGALDLALAHAEKVDAELVVANDPDTDRLCVAVAQPDGFRVLNGNELGVLLADWLLSQRSLKGQLPPRAFVATSLVSTSMLKAVGAHWGAGYIETLTGFKWIWERSLEEIAAGGTFVFGFEEALGYCIGAAVRDKDGVGAAQILMELAAHLKAEGRTLLDQLDGLYRRHGVYINEQVSVRLPGRDGQARIDAIMASLRGSQVTEVAGHLVETFHDLLGPDADALGLTSSNVLIYRLAGGCRLVMRPSGTEPKLKGYVEVCEPVGAGETVDVARQRAVLVVQRMVTWIEQIIEGT